MFLNLKFLLFLVLVSTQLTLISESFLVPLWWKTNRWRKFQIVTRRLNPYEKSHMSATTQNRKFDKNDRFKERKQLRLLCSDWSTDYVKHHSQNIRNVQKNQTMKLIRTLFASLLLIGRKLHKDPENYFKGSASEHKLICYKQIGYPWCLQKRYTRTEKSRNKN